VHDLRNTGFNILEYTIVGKRLNLILSTIMNRHGGSIAQIAKRVIFLIWLIVPRQQPAVNLMPKILGKKN
jgi:hypothetical protein